MLSGEYKNPVRVVAFNTAEKWSQDVSREQTYRFEPVIDRALAL
jgi:hypothetical protein